MSNRLETIFKKASELCTLCEIEACVIYYGPDGELKTWPKEREKVRDIALRYSLLEEAVRRKKSFNLYQFLNKKKMDKTNLMKKAKKTDNDLKNRKNVNDLKYPISDHYSPDQISQLIQSLELNVSTLQERLRFVETQKQKEAKLDHPISLNHHHQDQTQSLNPSQFSLFMYNHGDATLSQIPLSASNFNQDFSKFQRLYDEFLYERSSGKHYTGSTAILSALSDIRNTLTGDLPSEKLVHVVEKLHCKPHGNGGVMIRAIGSFIVGNQFLICGDGVQAEGLPSFKDLGFDVASRRVGRFQEQFVVESGDLIGKYFITKQELYITNLD